MGDLEKISQVMALKRSRTENEISRLGLQLRQLDDKILRIRDRNCSAVNSIAPGKSSGNPVNDARVLVRWQDVMVSNIQALQAQKTKILPQLDMQKQILKEILVKEDIINARLKVFRQTRAQIRIEGESSARLENWVVSKYQA